MDPVSKVTFRKLSGSGHDEYTKEGTSIEEEFKQLIASGYALFTEMTQIKSLKDAQVIWEDLTRTSPEYNPAPVYAVPALRGGRD